MRPFNRGRGNVNNMSESRCETIRGGRGDRPERNFERFENERKRNDERSDYRRSTPCEKNSNCYYNKNYRERRGSLHIEDRWENDDCSQRTRRGSGSFLDRKNDREYEYDSGTNHRENRGYTCSQDRFDYEDDSFRENYGHRERNYQKKSRKS